ncbi:MAG: fumarylacetoacetate hydrolase family protein, partial [Actinomycetota bacterium]|nr:fumarylacetoacetate hydrolase family protein [Actinomycetota bacterium]
MQLITFAAGNGPRAGVLTSEGILDAWEILDHPTRSSLRELIWEDRVGEVADRIAAGTGVAPLDPDGCEIKAPVPDPDKIICIGLNYRAHAEETGQDLPKAPIIFGKYRNALAADGQTVTLPAASSKVDYEAEVAVVIGRRAREVSTDDALQHVAGYTLLNDLSARDLQGLTSQWMAGKVFDGSAPCGPTLVTPDEAGPHDQIGISLILNGEEMQNSNTGDLIFPVPELI